MSGPAAAGANAAFITALRAAFAAHANAERAPQMQAYMKSALPFYGIAMPERRALQAAVLKAHPLRDTAERLATMRALWRSATRREEWYAAIELARPAAALKPAGLALLPLFEEMITTSAWWDTCDDISGNGLAALLRRHPAEMKPLLRRWARGGDLWLRRAAMLCQRKLKQDCDAVLLYDCILPSLAGSEHEGDRFAREFFINKGMGWALRERAYTAPEEVRAFCREYAARLSPLTRREALRVVGAG